MSDYLSATDLAAEIEARIARISVANGFHTDVGLRLFAGKLRVDLSDLPCTVLVEGDDKVREQTGRSNIVRLTQVYAIEGHAECDADRPNDVAHMILKDLKRAVFGTPFKVGGRELQVLYQGRAFAQREPGSKITAASIRVAIEYAENLLEP